MQRVSREHITYRFAPDVPPVAAVEPGETLVLETYDASTGRIRRKEDVEVYHRVRDPRRVNPATGPVEVRGAEPGDALRVTILDIRLDHLGFVRMAPGVGTMKAEIERPVGTIVRVERGHLLFDCGVKLPLRPMVGVIGTAPAAGEYLTAVPSPIGGNLDFNDITVGAVAHLPVHVPGALLALGDVHASMGDAEATGTGVEICAEVTVRVEVEKGVGLHRPWFETPTHWITYAHHADVQRAINEAVSEMATFLTRRLGVSREDAFFLITVQGDVRLGQACDFPGIDATVRVLFPKLDGW